MTSLVEALRIERIGDQEFVAPPPAEPPPLGRLFGGQVVAQAMLAAGATANPDHEINSLHCYFLRPGDPLTPTSFRVSPMRDSRSFTTRRVTAEQDGRAIFEMAASFALSEPGLQHQVLAPPGLSQSLRSRVGTPIPQPWDLGDEWVNDYIQRDWMDFRRVIGHNDDSSPQLKVWARLLERPSDTMLYQAAGLAYLSDMLMMNVVTVGHNLDWEGDTIIASLDHVMWLHHPFLGDDWLLHELDSPVANEGRVLTRSQVFNTAGVLVASIAQEGMARPRRRRG